MKMKILSVLLFFYVAYDCHAISDRDLYNTNAPGSTSLPNTNEESQIVNLRSPINFYSEKYNSIYVSHMRFFLFLRTLPPMSLWKEGSTSVVIYLDRQMTMTMMMFIIHKIYFAAGLRKRLKLKSRGDKNRIFLIGKIVCMRTALEISGILNLKSEGLF